MTSTLLVLVLAAFAQAAPSAVTSELEQFEQRLASTYKAGDCAGWAAMLAPEWSVIHLAGHVITKAQALQLCNAPRPAIDTMAIDDVSVRAYGDAAVVTGRTTAVTAGANAQSITLRFTDVFVRRDGRWQVVASQATRVAP
jgi:hypothetical protein